MKVTNFSIMVVAFSLLLIGIVSNTPIRHIVQLIPAIVVVLLSKKSWNIFAILAILIFWFFIVLMIWLFLLGLSDIARGEYSEIEIILTIIIGISCLVGIISSLHIRSSSKRIINIMAFVTFLVFQIAMMWISFQGNISGI